MLPFFPAYRLLLLVLILCRLLFFCLSFISFAVALAHRPATVMFQVSRRPLVVLKSPSQPVPYYLPVSHSPCHFVLVPVLWLIPPCSQSSACATQSIRGLQKNKLVNGPLKLHFRAPTPLVIPRVAIYLRQGEPLVLGETPVPLSVALIPTSSNRSSPSEMMKVPADQPLRVWSRQVAPKLPRRRTPGRGRRLLRSSQPRSPRLSL